MATFPSSSCVQLREIPRADRVKTCACLMLQFSTLCLSWALLPGCTWGHLSPLGLDWAPGLGCGALPVVWQAVVTTVCWDTGPEGGCVSAEQGITSPEQSLTSLLSYTCTQNTLSQQSFQSLTCGSLWIQIFPDFSSILCRCKGWCGWMSLLAQCSVWLLL